MEDLSLLPFDAEVLRPHSIVRERELARVHDGERSPGCLEFCVVCTAPVDWGDLSWPWRSRVLIGSPRVVLE